MGNNIAFLVIGAGLGYLFDRYVIGPLERKYHADQAYKASKTTAEKPPKSASDQNQPGNTK